MNAKHDWAAKKAEEILGQSDVPLVAWLARDIATALRDAARVPEGCVRTADGVDRKVLGTLPITADGCVPGLGASVSWPGYGEEYVYDGHVRYSLVWAASIPVESSTPVRDCYSTREAAEAALAQPTPAHGENLCRSCGRHRDTHVGTQRSCFGGTGEIFTPAREEGENVTCEHDIIRTACPTCNIWASTHRPKEPAND